jgi:hypothetical protein
MIQRLLSATIARSGRMAVDGEILLVGAYLKDRPDGGSAFIIFARRTECVGRTKDSRLTESSIKLLRIHPMEVLYGDLGPSTSRSLIRTVGLVLVSRASARCGREPYMISRSSGRILV